MSHDCSLQGNGFGTMIPDKILKVDTKTKEWTMWREKGAYPSEPVFVNRPGATDEQDGVILSILIYSDGKRPIELICLGNVFEARTHDDN